MPNLDPKPYITLNGAELDLSLSEGAPVVLEGLRITWGRSNPLEGVDPATLSLKIWDRDGSWIRGQALLGLEIIVGVRFVDSQGIARDFKNFRGRVTYSYVDSYTRETATGTDYGYMINVEASDKLTEVANRFMAQQSWPNEYYGARRDRFQAALSGVVNGIGGAYVSTQLLFSPKYFSDQVSVLDLITEHLAAGVEWVNYDPDTNRIEATGRVSYEGGDAQWTGLRFAQVDDGSGKYGLETDVSDFYAPFPRNHYNVDAGSLTEKSGIKRTIESSITEIRYEHSTNDIGTKATYVLGTGLPQSIYGVRSYNITTSNRNNVDIFADNYRKAAVAMQTWQPPEVEWDTRRPDRGFQHFVQVRGFISGRAWPDPFFLSRNEYNSFPSRVPIYRVIGGTMTYSKNAAGVSGWVVTPQFGPVEFPGSFTPLKWNTINPSTSPVIKWSDLDATATWNDINLTGQGV